jgi:multidrug efflux pump
MKISDLSIQRPVLASMLSLALVLFGVIGYTQLAVREFPDVDAPIVSVSTVLPGANPQVVESAVTDILEEELSTVEGLRTLTSSSGEGVSNISLEFNLERDVEAAAQDTRDKVARIRERLPEDVEEPVVAKQDADAQPFFWLALTGENYDLLQLSDIGDRLVKTRLQSLPGVGQAHLRRTPVLHARLAVGFRASRSGTHRSGRTAGHPVAQRGGPGRPDRVGAAGVHGPFDGRAQDARRIR